MNSKRPIGLIVSPYHARSHAVWADQLMRLISSVEWRSVTMPARFFNWRIRGNPLALVYDRSYRQLFKNIDFLIATSMTDLATLKGLLPELSQVPALIYFHENQFAYPENQNTLAGDKNRLEAKMVSLYGALCADAVAFNSAFNRDTFLDGARRMLRNFPDHASPDCVDLIAEKSDIIAVPLPPRPAGAMHLSPLNERHHRQILNVAWNHRWEYDKGPERLLKIIEMTDQYDLACRFFVFGQGFRQVPEGFSNLAERYPDRVGHVGFVADEHSYYRQLANCDVVLSTAFQDFQGLAILEAIRLGCVPLVPDRLAYREYVREDFRYPSLPRNAEAECELVVVRLKKYQQLLAQHQLPSAEVPDRFDDKQIISSYIGAINRLLVHGEMATMGDSI